MVPPTYPAGVFRDEGREEASTVMGYYGGWGWGGWLAMSLMMLLFWALIVAGVVALIRTSRREPRNTSGSDEAQRLLDERFARGEIDEDDYRHRRELLTRR